MDDKLEIIYARRSIRVFKSDPLPREVIEELLQAAMSAPSAANRQPWRFLVITEPALRQRVSEAHPNAKFATQSPAVVFIFGDPVGELFDHDLAAATENLLVAAAGLGLGACWCGVTDERRPKLHAATGIPERLRIVSMICVGYPAERKEPRTQFDQAKVYYERYPMLG